MYRYSFFPAAFSARLLAALDKPTLEQRIQAIDAITDAMADAGLVRPRSEDKIALPDWNQS